MKKSRAITALLVPALSLCAQAAEPPDGFTALFNGTDLSGWWGLRTANPAQWMAQPAEKLETRRRASLENIRTHWRVEDGVLINDGKGLALTTERNYADFELVLEYRIEARADSGVYLRGIPQVQIWDYTDESKSRLGAGMGSGGLWNNRKQSAGRNPLVRADHPVGEWNRMRILMVGERVSVELNGQRVVDHARLENYFDRTVPLPRTGPVQLQTHGGETRWRNIFIREIAADEAIRMLASRHGDGFESVFNGRNLEGWTGKLENYEVVDGAIRCTEGQGGILYTKQEYGDFAVQMEFMLPAEGNNGLAIRYPGRGNPAYAGMCELQVLDNTAGKYAELDPRQYHGSAYGMTAAHRGYLRPVGEWNFQSVDVIGSTITVELNGTRILHTDLSTVTEYAQNKKHPGKNLACGHFGFCGHKSPVAFRNILIKELNNEAR
jgi:hypothetical protein